MSPILKCCMLCCFLLVEGKHHRLWAVSLFSEVHETRKWPRAWLKAQDGSSRARALLSLNLKKKRDCLQSKSSIALYRARNNGRSTDNVRTDCGFDRSNFGLAGHVDRSKFNRIENEINLRFLLFSCFSCYLSSCCVLRNFDMKSWWHATKAVVYNSRIETDIGIPPLPVTKLPNISTFISNFQVVHLSLRIN